MPHDPVPLLELGGCCHFSDQGFEVVQGEGVVAGVEGFLVPLVGELFA